MEDNGKFIKNNDLDSDYSDESSAKSYLTIEVKHNNEEIGKTLGDLMISKIDHLFIGFEPLKFSFDFLHRFMNDIAEYRHKFPNICAKRFVHANVFLATKKLDDENYDGILIEYGKYGKYGKSFKNDDDSDYKHKAFSIDKTGLRFREITLNDFKLRMDISNEYTKNISYIKCEVKSTISFHRLIEKIIFGFSNNSLLYKILSDYNLNKIYFETFSGGNYNIFNYNCQTFVAKLIESINATIDLKDKLYGQDFNNLKAYVPPVIVDALEKNTNGNDNNNDNDNILNDADDNLSEYSNDSFNKFYRLNLIYDN